MVKCNAGVVIEDDENQIALDPNWARDAEQEEEQHNFVVLHSRVTPKYRKVLLELLELSRVFSRPLTVHSCTCKGNSSC
jgi:hypothetical protein